MKHIGRHGERKVAVVFREVPGQEHMCLVVYPGTLNTPMHDSLMKALESNEAQNEKSLADALNRMLFSDGRPMLGTLHAGGYLKKVEAKQVYMTPNPKSSINLAEMNEIINKMEAGEDARQQMEQLDANAGMVNPREKATAPANTGALSDEDLAKSNLDQAAKMEAEAEQLVAEAKRLKAEAKKLVPAKATAKVTAKTSKAKKTTAKKTTAKKTAKKVSTTTDSIEV